MKHQKRAHTRTSKQSSTSKPAGLQWSLDDESSHQEELVEKQTRQVIKNFDNSVREEEEEDIHHDQDSIYRSSSSSSSPPTPPSPPPSSKNLDISVDGKWVRITDEWGRDTLIERPCLYDDPMTRETIRRQLKELGILNVRQLIRTQTAAKLIDAISDFEELLYSGHRIKNRTSFFRRLLQ